MRGLNFLKRQKHRRNESFHRRTSCPMISLAVVLLAKGMYASPTSAPSNFPSVSMEPTATRMPSMEPTATRMPSMEPSAVPSLEPSAVPSLEPSALPSLRPSLRPSSQPSSTPRSAPAPNFPATPSPMKSPLPEPACPLGCSTGAFGPGSWITICVPVALPIDLYCFNQCVPDALLFLGKCRQPDN